MKRVFVLSGVMFTAADGTQTERAFTLADVPMLEAALIAHPDCKLVVIDPIGSYLGGETDAHRDNEVRAVLAPLAKLASRFNVAIVMVAHRRKSSGDFADDGVLGSRAFTGIARAVWHLSRDPEDKPRRLLLPGKNNLTPEGEGLAFRIEGKPGRIVWEDGPVMMTADDAQFAEARTAAEKRKPGPNPEARQKAANWLQEQLVNGPKARADLQSEAEKAGVKWRTVERAADDLKLIKGRSGFGGKALWRLPNTCTEEPQNIPRQDDLDQSRHDSQEGNDLASWRECEIPTELADSGPSLTIPATSPESGGTEAKPKKKRKPKPARGVKKKSGDETPESPRDGRLFTNPNGLPD